MNLPRQLVERKLTGILKLPVRIDTLNVSVLSASIEASGVRIGGVNETTPLLSIGKIRADVSMTKMLKKQIVITALRIETPVLSVMAGDNPWKVLGDPQTDSDREAKDAGDETDTGSPWKLAAENMKVLDGAVHYRDQSYHASVERIIGEMVRRGDGFDFTLLAQSTGRRDEALELGEARAEGRFSGTTDLTALASAKLTATFGVGDMLGGSIASAKLSDLEFETDIHAKVSWDKLSRLFPRAGDRTK